MYIPLLARTHTHTNTQNLNIDMYKRRKLEKTTKYTFIHQPPTTTIRGASTLTRIISYHTYDGHWLELYVCVLGYIVYYIVI